MLTNFPPQWFYVDAIYYDIIIFQSEFFNIEQINLQSTKNKNKKIVF